VYFAYSEYVSAWEVFSGTTFIPSFTTQFSFGVDEQS
jgi:hypothetical protein